MVGGRLWYFVSRETLGVLGIVVSSFWRMETLLKKSSYSGEEFNLVVSVGFEWSLNVSIKIAGLNGLIKVLKLYFVFKFSEFWVKSEYWV